MVTRGIAHAWPRPLRGIGHDHDRTSLVTRTPWRSIRIGWPALYTIVDGDTYAEQMVEFEAMSPGLTLYSATFG